MIPVFQQWQHLLRCVESAGSQMEAGDKLVIVYEGVENVARKQFDQIASRCVPSIAASPVYIHSEEHERWGISKARNEGVKAAPDAEWIKFLDADDVLAPFALQSFRKITIPDWMPVVSGQMLKVVGGSVQNGLHEPGWRLFEQMNPALVSACFIRRSAFDKVGGFNEAIGFEEDWDLWFKIMREFPQRNGRMPCGLVTFPVCYYWIDAEERAAKVRDHSVEYQGERIDVREYFRRHYGATPI